jgi:hypothetical protein
MSRARARGVNIRHLNNPPGWDEPLTAEQFEQEYAENSGVTVEFLRENGRVVCSCECGDPICLGWQSINRTLAEEQGLEIVLPSPTPTLAPDAGETSTT